MGRTCSKDDLYRTGAIRAPDTRPAGLGRISKQLPIRREVASPNRQGRVEQTSGKILVFRLSIFAHCVGHAVRRVLSGFRHEPPNTRPPGDGGIRTISEGTVSNLTGFLRHPPTVPGYGESESESSWSSSSLSSSPFSSSLSALSGMADDVRNCVSVRSWMLLS